MAKPTHEDALIVLQLAQLEATLNMSDASNWMWSDEFVTDGGDPWPNTRRAARAPANS